MGVGPCLPYLSFSLIEFAIMRVAIPLDSRLFPHRFCRCSRVLLKHTCGYFSERYILASPLVFLFCGSLSSSAAVSPIFISLYSWVYTKDLCPHPLCRYVQFNYSLFFNRVGGSGLSPVSKTISYVETLFKMCNARAVFLDLILWRWVVSGSLLWSFLASGGVWGGGKGKGRDGGMGESKGLLKRY